MADAFLAASGSRDAVRELVGANGEAGDDLAEHRVSAWIARQPLVRACRCVHGEGARASAPWIAK